MIMMVTELIKAHGRARQSQRPLTGVLPADVLQVEVWVIGHVFLHPGPAVDLLVCGRNNEEATGRKCESD